MINRIDPVLDGFNEAVLDRWGLNPNAKETLTRAKERGAITPQEITQMISTALAKDRQKMAEVLQEIKKILQNLNITVTFNVVHTHTHTHEVVHPPHSTAQATVKKPDPKKEATPALEVNKPRPQTGPEQGTETIFLNHRLLNDQGLVPEAFNILSAAKSRGQISPQEIGTLIPMSISKDGVKLRETMRWITQLLGSIDVKIVIGSVHVKKPGSKSPETSYSIKPEQASPPTRKLSPVIERSIDADSELSEEGVLALEKEEPDLTDLKDEESEEVLEEDFLPKFGYQKEDADINPYYRAVKNHKFLKHEDLLELSRRWHMHGDIEARNNIVRHNLRLAMKIARHYMGRGLDYDELVQEGNCGLIIAADRFNPELGFRFTTYATWWVRQAITRAIQNLAATIRLPVHIIEARYKLLKIVRALGFELQREPMLEEIAARAGEDTDKVNKILNQLKVPVISLGELAYGSSSDSKKTVGDLTEELGTPTPLTAIEMKENLAIAAKNLRTLLAAVNALDVSDKAKTCFKMYYGLEGYPEGATLESISPTFGVTRERIRQLNSKVWEKLAEHGIEFDDRKLVAEIQRVHDLEDLVDAVADVSSSIENFVLDAVSIVFQNVAEVGGDIVPAVIITPRRLKASLNKVKPGDAAPEDIIRVVSESYGLTPEVILGDERPKETVWVRWVCTYIMREKLKSPFVSIAQALHYADHTTAMYGHKSITKVIEREPAVKEEIDKIISLCGFQKDKPLEQEEPGKVVEPKERSPIVEQVLDLTCEIFKIEKSVLFDKSHTRPDADEKHRITAKRFAMYIMRTDFNIQRQDIAEVFGFRDPGRVSVLCSTVAEDMETDAGLQKIVTLIRSRYSLEVYGGDLEKVRQHQNALYPQQVWELEMIVENTVTPFKDKVRRLHAKIDSLDVPDRHKEILKLRCSGDLSQEIQTLEAIGQKYDITRARIQQILAAAQEKLSPLLDESDIHPDIFSQEFDRVRFVVELQKL